MNYQFFLDTLPSTMAAAYVGIARDHLLEAREERLLGERPEEHFAEAIAHDKARRIRCAERALRKINIAITMGPISGTHCRESHEHQVKMAKIAADATAMSQERVIANENFQIAVSLRAIFLSDAEILRIVLQEAEALKAEIEALIIELGRAV